ncbi:conserved unknown protein [Ectocarpus siliculosus]|uniref:Uncharacterized protein n=1 Tax=Ectocarpus siliculosus TaxID=2880 RepID=D8LEZ4_ECTSI|nr:conserved unknown protein [Ectocarpus siliculosus]|eukprot:CBN79814.1 conserved unknown protein [Ectocarpus siliculosus]
MPGTDGSPQAEERGATGEAHSSGPGEASSHNSVDDLLRRIAREVRARQARSDDNSRRGTSEDSHGGDRRRHVNNSGSSQRQLHQKREHRHPSHEDSTRTSRWGKTSESGASAQSRGAGVGMREASVRTTAEVSAAEANPFVEHMWEDASCRQVLQAMFFAQDSAIPAGSTEEYKELEEFVPKFLVRREKAKAAAAAKAKFTPKDGASTPPAAAFPSTRDPPQDSSVFESSAATAAGPSAPKPLPPALSALPTSFHKRYLVNFTVLSPEQQRAAQEAQQQREVEEDGMRNGRRGRRGRLRDVSAASYDPGKAALRELARRGVLEREEVKAMLMPGPMADFRGSVLQAFIDFRMRRSLAKVVKIRRDRASLPIAAFQNAIVRAVASNPCVLVAGDTGCGKSTQVPQYLLQAGYGRVACTQPRRISAMGLCRRVSYETLHEHGSEVAYQVRFDSSRRRSSRILFLTEGLLLRQIASDPNLSSYSVVIVDEVHERHAGCDFLLGLLRAVLRRRPDLKVVLMSATINPELFSRFFDGAPLIRVPGRMHPVEVRYVPTAADNDIQEVVSKHDGEGQRKLRSRGGGGGEGKRVMFDARPYVKLLESIDTTTPRDERGDLLVFLSGMSDMLAVTEGVREYVEAKSPRRWVVLMLHSSLSVEEQDKARDFLGLVFDASPLGTRKMILATNIAETSVTIDGVRFVCDSGKAKEMSWDPASGVRSLQEFWVSRASAEQRKGRAGRTGPGVCFRLYARSTFDRLPPFAEPEIRRCPLEGLVLQMKSLGLDDPRYFPYLSPPPPENLRAALESLALLGATDAASAVSVPAAAADEAATAAAAITEGAVAVGSDPRGGAGLGAPHAERLPAAPESNAEPRRREEGTTATTTPPTFDDATARAPLTPLGRVLSALPVDPSVGKMLALGALFGESEHVLTLAAALSTQTPFDARAAAAASGANPVAEFASSHGDPFTVMNAYDEWIRVKAARKESSRRWCKRHGLQEQRLYEITKLRRQFEDLLGSAGLIWLGAAAQRARQARAARGGAGGRPSKEKLRELKMRREGRKRKVLQVDGGGDAAGNAGEGGSGGEDVEEARRDLRGEVGEGEVDGEAGLDLSSLEFYMAQDVDQLAESSGRRLARRDVAIIKAILCQGLYPQFAVADAGNAGRASNEQQYVTRPSGGLFMSPSSVLACQDFGIAATAGGTANGIHSSSSRGAAANAGRGDGLLCYGQLMETQRPFVSSVTPLPALQALLLFSARVDTSEDASLILFDHWLLVEMRGRDPALNGQKLLVVACGLRARLGALLSEALVEAERRKGTGGGGGRGFPGGGVRDQSATATTGDSRRGTRGQEGDDLMLQDLPPLLLMARRAWVDGGRLGGGGGGGGEGRRPERECERGDAAEVDWAQEAEALAVDLAEFMLQSIGYDVKSVSPRHVEALLVDTLRLRDPAEVRRVLGEYPGLPGEDQQNKKPCPAEEQEEIRGSKGLFGLETGVLERLKGGARVTPFLRHGSVRRQDSSGKAPHGLAAGGMKKWWRCPRCHVSQVVDLKAIHEHFKVCLVDPAPGSSSASGGTVATDASDKGHQEAAPPGKKKRRMVGTSVKGTLRK